MEILWLHLPFTDENETRGVKARVGVERGQVCPYSRCRSADAEITWMWDQNTHGACVTELLLWNRWGLAVVKAFATLTISVHITL